MEFGSSFASEESGHPAILRLSSDGKLVIGPHLEKTCLRMFANNTDSDQPAHPGSLIRAFVVRFLKSIISRLATSEMSIF